MLAAKICGVPCQINVTTAFVKEPQGIWAASDMDCYWYEELEYEVFDRRGYRAKWLEAKLDRDKEEAERLDNFIWGH